MKVITQRLPFSTKGFNDIVDITPAAQDFIIQNKLQHGQLLLFVDGSTAAITTIEYEPGLLQDLPDMLDRIVPMQRSYHHDDTWHDGNGYAHLRSALVGASFTVPVLKSRLLLGAWQQIILLDFDNRPRQRRVVAQFCGE